MMVFPLNCMEKHLIFRKTPQLGAGFVHSRCLSANKVLNVKELRVCWVSMSPFE